MNDEINNVLAKLNALGINYELDEHAAVSQLMKLMLSALTKKV